MLTALAEKNLRAVTTEQRNDKVYEVHDLKPPILPLTKEMYPPMEINVAYLYDVMLHLASEYEKLGHLFSLYNCN